MSRVAGHILSAIMTPTQQEVEIAQLRLRLAAADAVALAAIERAKKLQAEVDRMQPEFDAIIAANEELRAEVAGWRRAVRWHTIGNDRVELRVRGVGAYSHELGAVSQYTGGWTVEMHGVYKPGIQPDRNAACTRVCELLGIPVVLPVGGE